MTYEEKMMEAFKQAHPPFENELQFNLWYKQTYGKDSIMTANESAMHYFLCSQALCPQDD